MATIILVQRRRRFIARRRIIFQKKSNKIQINYIISGNSLFLNSFHREQIVNFVFLCLKVIFRSFLRWRADRRAVKFFTALCYGFIIRKKQLFKLYLFFLLQRGYNRLMRITDALLLSVLRLTIPKHNKKSLPCGFSGNKKNRGLHRSGCSPRKIRRAYFSTCFHFTQWDTICQWQTRLHRKSIG